MTELLASGFSNDFIFDHQHFFLERSCQYDLGVEISKITRTFRKGDELLRRFRHDLEHVIVLSADPIQVGHFWRLLAEIDKLVTAFSLAFAFGLVSIP